MENFVVRHRLTLTGWTFLNEFPLGFGGSSFDDMFHEGRFTMRGDEVVHVGLRNPGPQNATSPDSPLVTCIQDNRKESSALMTSNTDGRPKSYQVQSVFFGQMLC